jgi:hypothetical protein
MILRNMIFYTIVGSLLWGAGSKLGAGMGVNLALALLVPPALLLGYALYRNRGPLR